MIIEYINLGLIIGTFLYTLANHMDIKLLKSRVKSLEKFNEIVLEIEEKTNE